MISKPPRPYSELELETTYKRLAYILDEAGQGEKIPTLEEFRVMYEKERDSYPTFH